MAAIPSFYCLYYSDSPPPVSSFLWNYVYRPAFVWELVHLLWLPVALVFTLLGALFNLIRGQKNKGLQKLFKESRGFSRFLDLRIVALAIMLALAAYGYYRQLQPPEIRQVTVPIRDLNPSLYGYRIALLSDFHYGRGQNITELAASMAMAAAQRPDLVILAGDLVERKAAFGLDYRVPLLSLREVPGGVYAVLGNHDLEVDSVDALVANLEGLGLKVLRNSGAHVPNKPLTLLGFDDLGQESLTYHGQSGTLDFGGLGGQTPRYGDLAVVVKHRPEGLEDASAVGIKLFLAGHTHGGQVQAPWAPQTNVASFVFGYPYTVGLYTISELTLYVTGGLASGSQARFLAWPEITILTLSDIPN
ncbi:MAG: metallophosphoesterase [Deltaproteobacteria bacterium]|nr:metallophosphoesterase [Deltaproteobacteria bacterium]